jgi:thymidine kinase
VSAEDLELGIEVLTPTMMTHRLAEMLETASTTQKMIYETVMLNSHLAMHVVLGAAGVGKSFLLNMLYFKYTLLGYTVVKMAPTGVASRNIGGVTIHQFFGMGADGSYRYSSIALDRHFKTNRKTLLLIDECSMLSKRMIEVLNAALVMVSKIYICPYAYLR